VPLLGPCVQLTAIGLLNSIFEDDGERQSAAASRRVYRTEDKARFAGIATTAIDKAATQVYPIDDGEKEKRSFGKVEFTGGQFGPIVDEALNVVALRDQPLTVCGTV